MKRILLAEHSDVMKELYKVLISSLYEDAVFVSASNGRDAARLALEDDYALIIANIEMPVVNGIEFYERLKSKDPRLLTKFVFTSELPDPYRRFFASEVCLWLEKPFSNREFLCVVDFVMGGNGLPAAAAANPYCSRRICKLRSKRCAS